MSNEYKDWYQDLKNAPVGSIEHNRYLCMEYPFLIPRNRWSDEEINCDYNWTELDAMPDGWRRAFGEEMCAEIRDVLKQYNQLYNYRILQIKEKYGSLCWYDGGIPRKAYDKIDRILQKYEELSRRTCIVCGKPATKITTGWISPYCDDCVSKDENAVPIEKWFNHWEEGE
jgi:hypothetical protein